MRPLSATEAITPAIDHTKALLRSFSIGLWLKLGFVACFAEMGGQFISSPVNRFPRSGSPAPGIGSIAGSFTPILVGIFIAIAIVGLIIGLVMLYLSSRLQLVLMDLVATRTTIVGDAWHRTASRTWRWIGGKVACFLIFFAGIAVIAAVPILYLIRSLPASRMLHPGPGFFGVFALFFLTIIVAVLVLVAIVWLLRDFVLPFILFEDASFGDALRRAATLIRNEPGPVFVYFLLKFGVGFVAGIVAELCILVAALIVGIPTGLIGFVLWSLLHNLGPSGTIVMYLAFGVLGVVFFAVFVSAILCLGGAVLIFYQAYALYFLGGRLPALGNLLQPPPPPYYAPMPVQPFVPA